MPRTILIVLNQPSTEAPPHWPGAAAFRRANPALPQLEVTDLGVTRGDGVFESISIADGELRAVDAHLQRFARSAALLDLPTPHPSAWVEAIDAAAASIDPVPEAAARIFLTRGVEGDARPTGWVYAAPSPDHTDARTIGLRVVVLDRGYSHTIEATSPWVLASAKSLSYAVNRAALREAARRGADDVIFVSSDGFVLEGPTSSVLYRRGNYLGTPGAGQGILAGTTQGDIFRWGASHGFDVGSEQLTPAQLRTTDAAWLVSSGRRAAPIRSLDGHAHPVDVELTAAFNDFLRAG